MSKPLTPQELWVLYYLHNGLTNPLIASAMELSKNTVKVHKSNLYKKLGLLSLGKEEAFKQLQKFVATWPDLFDNLCFITDEQLEKLHKPALLALQEVNHKLSANN